jgi:hypothetical protein
VQKRRDFNQILNFLWDVPSRRVAKNHARPGLAAKKGAFHRITPKVDTMHSTIPSSLLSGAIHETSASLLKVGVLAAVIWFAPQLIENTSSPCGAFAARQIATQARAPAPLFGPALSYAAGDFIMSLAMGPRHPDMPSQLSCLGYYWEALLTQQERMLVSRSTE